MPGSLPVSTILFGLISAFLTIPGFHTAEPVPIPAVDLENGVEIHTCPREGR